MDRVIVKSKVGNDGVLRLDLPLGDGDANREVQVTVEPAQTAASKPYPRACDILTSGIVGMWADRNDIGDSREFARRLRQDAETRRRDP